MRALILAAGKGERLEPLTETQPKAMLPLVGKPLLQHVVEAVREAGIKEITIVIGYLGDAIRSHFGDGSELGVSIDYLVQEKRLGTAHAIAQASFDEEFLVLNGDTLVSSEDIAKLIAEHQGAATIACRRVDDARGYGVVTLGKAGRVEKIVEKPSKPESNLINAGIYAFSPEVFEAIERTPLSPRGEYEITSTLELLLRKGEEVRGVEIHGRWLDIGTPWNYLEASKTLLEEMPHRIAGEVEGRVSIKGRVYLAEGAVIKSGSYIEGPVYIGRGSVIGPNTYLRSYAAIGEGCRLGNAVEVKNSIIMDGTHIAHLSYVGDSIIGRNCNFGAGAKVGNLRLDNANVKMRIKGELVDTGRRKMGAVIGDNVKLGLNVMINAGRKIGSCSFVGPGVIVYRDVPRNSFLVVKQELELREMQRREE